MRLFIALDCSSLEPELRKIQGFFPDKGLKKVKAFHLTLKFLGEVEDHDKIKAQLQKVSFEPIEAQLASLGVFPKISHPHVLWVGLEPKDKIAELQERIESFLPDFRADKRFMPHVTLARIKSKVGPEFHEALKKGVPEAKVRFDRFHLIKSTLTPKGPVYEIIGSFS